MPLVCLKKKRLKTLFFAKRNFELQERDTVYEIFANYGIKLMKTTFIKDSVQNILGPEPNKKNWHEVKLDELIFETFNVQ